MRPETKEAIKRKLDSFVEGSDKAADPLLTRIVQSKWTGVIVISLVILGLILYVA